MRCTWLGLSLILVVFVVGCESEPDEGTPGNPDGDVILPPDAAPPDGPPPPPPDAAPPADATAPNTECADDPPPTGDVPATITVTGTAQTLQGMSLTVVADAVAEARLRQDDSVLATDMTDMAGAFELGITTGGAPVDGYLALKKMGLMDTYLFAPDPLRADFAAPNMGLVMFSPTLLGLLGQFLGVQIQQGDGLAMVNVVDCLGGPANETTLEVVGGDNDTAIADLSEVAGVPVALIVNIPIMTDGEGNPLPTEVTLKAKYNTIDFQPNVIKVFANSVTVTQVHP